MKWSEALTKVQTLVRNLLASKKPFWCDSHVNLCVPCKRLRDYVRYRKNANLIIINTKNGLFWWSSLKGLGCQKIG